MKELLLIGILLTSSGIFSQSLYYPPNTGNQWDTLDPSSLGYCEDKIDSLYDFLEQEKSKAFILLKDGKIVLEKYFGTFERDSLWYWASAGKTLTAAVVGVAQQENYLNISDSSYRYLGKGWTISPKESHITIKDQLSMTTGLDDGVPNVDCTYDTCLQYLSDPGNRWAYHNAPYTMLDSVIYYATGQSINQYLFSKIRNPIGMNGAYIKLGFNNVYFSNARSMARFGLLLLGNGTWKSTAIISDTSYLSDMHNTSQNLNESYGYLTWLNGKSTFMVPGSQLVIPGPMNADAPADMYAALGKNGQLLNVVPSQNLVWVRMGDPPTAGGGLISPFLNNDIWKKINDLSCSTGIDASQNEKEVRVYPNPVNDYLNIEWPSEIDNSTYTISDVNGRKLKTGVLSNSTKSTISFVGLEGGMYLLRISDGSQYFMKKLILVNQH